MNISGTSDSHSDRGESSQGIEFRTYAAPDHLAVALRRRDLHADRGIVAARIPREPDAAVTSALDAIRSGDPAARKSAIKNVTQAGLSDSARSIPAVIEALADPDATVRVSAAESLGLLGSYAVWARMTGTVAEGQDQGTIDTATKALLGSMAGDAQPVVRAAAARGLGNISATSPQPPRSRRGAKKAEAKGKAEEEAAPSPFDYKATMAALIAALADKDEDVRASAAATSAPPARRFRPSRRRRWSRRSKTNPPPPGQQPSRRSAAFRTASIR